MNPRKVWLITGCSTGFGRSLAEEVLKNGDTVAVTARNTNDIQDIVNQYPNNSKAIPLDVTQPAQIESAVKQTLETFGRIDVLVNNAGIGYFAAVEESEEADVRRMFEINVFGLAHMTQAVLPTMRAQKSGHILNIASIGGLVGFPGVGFYNATKFAVAGLSEALSKEVSHLGIKVTTVCPSGFRTDWAGRSAKDTGKQIADYEQSAHANMNTIRGYSGKQPGNPQLAAKAMIKVVEDPNPPLHLLLGKAAVTGARKKIEWLTQDIDAWEETSTGADSPE